MGTLRNYIGGFRAYNRERKQVLQAISLRKELLMGRIVRYVHSIEKGLSVESPRPEFGYEKIIDLYGWIREYLALGEVDRFCVYMAADALNAYCVYHENIEVVSEKLEEIKRITKELQEIKNIDQAEGIFGGIQTIKKEDLLFEQSDVEKLFKSRHSIRQFKKEPIPDELIFKAVELAQTAPSACNRQAVRAYAIDTKKFIEIYTGSLQGLGGFVDSCDRIILVTGKISAYEAFEYKQFIVSAGIFAGYLSLSLHALGLGACVIQRSLRPDSTWKSFCQKTGIPMDEQIVCMVTVGQLNEETIVPLSKRFDTKSVLKFL